MNVYSSRKTISLKIFVHLSISRIVYFKIRLQELTTHTQSYLLHMSYALWYRLIFHHRDRLLQDVCSYFIEAGVFDVYCQWQNTRYKDNTSRCCPQVEKTKMICLYFLLSFYVVIYCFSNASNQMLPWLCILLSKKQQVFLDTFLFKVLFHLSFYVCWQHFILQHFKNKGLS